MSIEKLRRSLEWAFGEVSVEPWTDGRSIASVDGYITAKEGNIAPLAAFGDTDDDAVHALGALINKNAVKKYVSKYPRQIADPSRVYTDEGHCVLYRNNQLIVK